MTTYNTYQEAKIASPESDIFTNTDNDKFKSKNDDRFFIRCIPKQHCMTVEKFLADGYKFVEGDIICGSGSVREVIGSTVNIMNSPGYSDKITYILRAAALEEKETESSNSTSWDEFLVDLNSRLSDEFSDCIKKHPSVSSGSGFEGRCLLVKEDTDFELVEISAREAVYWFDGLPDALYTSADGDEKYESLQHYINNLEDLGKSSLFVKLEKEKSNKQGLKKDCKKQLVDIAASIGAQLISPDKKPRTKVEYVKSDIESRGRALDAFDGEIELFELVNGEHKQVTTESDAISKWRNLYERIETPMTEREEFVDALNDLFQSHTMSTSDLFNAIVDSGKFKLVN